MEDEKFRLPFFSLGGIALVAGLEPDTVFLLVKKGVLTPQRDSNGKMLFKRADVVRWVKERD